MRATAAAARDESSGQCCLSGQRWGIGKRERERDVLFTNGDGSTLGSMPSRVESVGELSQLSWSPTVKSLHACGAHIKKRPIRSLR